MTTTQTTTTSPERIESVDQLERLLSEPTPAAVRAMGNLKGDLIVLGVAGKMGPTLARMAKRASEMAGIKRRVIGVSRFTSSHEESNLRSEERRVGKESRCARSQ